MYLRKLLPSSGAIFMFEAAARHQNFTAAGREFNVTQSAVSRMIGRLETHLDVRLFRRLATGLELTDEGRLLYRAVSKGFHEVEIALDEIRAGSGLVSVSVSSAFAMHWFMPRLESFKRTFPEIDLRFDLVAGEPAGPFDAVDFGVHYHPHPSTDHHSWKLIDEIVVPVCSPGYREQHGLLEDGGDLRGHTLAHLTGALRVPWVRFLGSLGYPEVTAARKIFFSDYSLVIQAAIKGQAVALGWWHVVAHECEQQGLVRAGRGEFRTGDAYYLVAVANRPLRKPAAMVRDWLIEELAAISGGWRHI